MRDAAAGPEVLLIERPDRGSFAGAWVFPGGKLEDADRGVAGEPEEDAARRAGVRETREEIGIAVDPVALATLSVWDPPPGLALRIRTWFFVAPEPEGTIELSADEAVAAEWLRPADALARHGRGELTLYPPTWVTLHGLSQHPDAGSILETARLAGVQHFETVARRGGEGPLLLWQDDAEYDPDASAPGTARHRLEIGSLPWRYTRSG
ncbi:NUDIX domain-containing protein [Microbacterium cremeum]|uniref:NUDIX domain-containing protein n=1 Tax=Microbacterium cremeum TaxID=2782169 RepID=UPI001F3B8926|nr:NUDIX domain-containing protein [Microbacterium cremeum]